MMGHCRYQAFRHGSFGAPTTLGLQATQLQFMPANTPRLSKHLSMTCRMIQQELFYAVACCPLQGAFFVYTGKL
jgi:hypothetical protein